jgi:hypothetical protein
MKVVRSALCSALTAITACGITVANAHPRWIEQGTVTAQSRFGHGTVSGPVRTTRFGREVRLPGGTWEVCARSCSETLRVSTVDFWEAQSGLGAACGVFGCLELHSKH